MRRTWIPVAGLAATLVLVVAACGGDGGAAASAKWADNACTSLSDWNYELIAAKASVESTSASRQDFVDELAKLDSATADLGGYLKQVKAPSGNDGRTAAVALDGLYRKLQSDVAAVREYGHTLSMSKDPTVVYRGRKVFAAKVQALSDSLHGRVLTAAAASPGNPGKALRDSKRCAVVGTAGA